MDMTASPTDLDFRRPGEYALFTSNYDLLSINEAVLAAHAKPWFRLVGGDGSEVAVNMIERGLAFYDTPFASGRPVARFSITNAGTYRMTHPSRPDFAFVVPDYTSGEEGAISIYMLLQALALGVGGWYVRRKTRRPLRRIVVPPPSRLSRENFVLRNAESERPMRSGPARAWQPDAALPVSAAERRPDANARDALAMLHEGEMTLHQAEAEAQEKFLGQPAGQPALAWGANLGLTPPETAAYSQGASMGDLLALRYEGWPSACAKCGQPVEHEQLRWWFVRDERGHVGLRHIDCPPKNT